MKLNDLYISDGIIENYLLRNDVVIVHFKDYQESRFSLRFNGVKKLDEQGSVGFSLCKAVITDNFWTVYDDDDVVLSIEFSSVEISRQ